jgi:class 3 adenylate cyclase
MSWKADRAEARIKKYLRTAPVVDRDVVLDSQISTLEKARGTGLLDEPPIHRAFVVSGVHLYGNLLDFDDLVAENGNETETSHRRLLQFLNMHYRVWDGIVDIDNCDRVDYHGARLHAVITTPSGNPAGQIERAVALAAKLAEAAQHVGRAHGFPSRIRFGIDQGTCLAMTTGRSHERDTLFLGRPANHAAKLAAQDNVEGIFLTETAQRLVSAPYKHGVSGRMALDEAFVQKATQKYTFDRLHAVAESLSDPRNFGPTFVFHRATPPLANVKFADLTPSNSVRMEMASIFADIDGYTAFVDAAICGGSGEIKRAVETIHVIREELNSVLKDDFGGKRIRFIGDCIHGCIAKGDRVDDMVGTIKEAALCASAMKSSFNLCIEIVKPGAQIDLAIGIECGPTPLTRIGDVGQDSVRCAASRATIEAERIQQKISGGGVQLGPTAVSIADSTVRRNFAAGQLMTFDAAADLLASPSSPVVKVIRDQPAARSHFARDSSK